MQSAAQGFLPADAVGGHPIAKLLRVLNRQAGETFVRLAAGHLPEIFPELLLAVRAGDVRRRRLVHVADVAGVAAVAAAKILGGAFEHEHPCAGASRHIAAHSPALPPPTTRTSTDRVRSFTLPLSSYVNGRQWKRKFLILLA